jgi:anti-sigma factor ChrR (cupin superfamily)
MPNIAAPVLPAVPAVSAPAVAAQPDIALHADFSQRVVLHAADATWLPSPLPGVQRRLLDRIGGEVARATSLVRYAPGSRFSRHVHDGGEEILVLEGVFSDETGDHPAGTYLRNPPGSAHAPFSHDGCLLFVKLRQFAPDDTTPVRIDTRDAAQWQPGPHPGVSPLPLHSHRGVTTLLVRTAPHAWFDTHSHPGGEELLVLDGTLHDDLGRYPRHSWVRSPRWSHHAPHTGDEGALSYVKLGHLAPAEARAEPPGAA